MCNASLSLRSWNVTVLGDMDKCKDVLSELSAIKPHLLLLQETKSATPNDQKICSFHRRSLNKFITLLAAGTAGGLLRGQDLLAPYLYACQPDILLLGLFTIPRPSIGDHSCKCLRSHDPIPEAGFP